MKKMSHLRWIESLIDLKKKKHITGYHAESYHKGFKKMKMKKKAYMLKLQALLIDASNEKENIIMIQAFPRICKKKTEHDSRRD